MIVSLSPKNNIKGLFNMGNHLIVGKNSTRIMSLSITENGSPVNLTGGSLYFSVKRSLDEPEASALIKKDTTVGVKSSLTLLDSLGSETLKILSASTGVLGDDLSVTITQNNKFNTLTTTNLNNGDFQADLADISGVVIGSVIEITDGVNSAVVIVSSILGNTIDFDPVSLPSTISAGSQANELSFNLELKKEQVQVELHENLSMESTNLVDYVVFRLQNGSLINADDLESINSDKEKIPANILDASLSGGVNFGGIELTNPTAGEAEIHLSSDDTDAQPRDFFYGLRYKSFDESFNDEIIRAELFTIKPVVGLGS